MDLKSYIRDVPGYPKPGIIFKDITPMWQNPGAFREMVNQLVARCGSSKVDAIAAIEARGLIIGSAMAFVMGTGLVPVRKAGKLPWNTVKASYSLEYGSATSEIHTDAFKPGAKILIVDDLLATGGTAEAAVKLVQELKGEVVGAVFLVELAFLTGRERLKPYGVKVISLLEYDQP